VVHKFLAEAEEFMRHHARKEDGWCFFMHEELFTLAETYYQKKLECDKLKDELQNLGNQIKDLMKVENRKNMKVGCYTIELEEKYDVSKEFVYLLKRKGMSGFITEECSLTNFKKACRIIGLSDSSRYLTLKPTLWLYVRKIGK
jgi:hypothetical protein